MYKATATANSNIALVKYWGKRDEGLVLPHQSSLSLTLSPLSVTTTVAFGVEEDSVQINGRIVDGTERRRVIDLLRKIDMSSKIAAAPVRVESTGNFPASAGLASSAAAFAALALAGRQAAGLSWDSKETSILARQGSGSAARSVEGGFCVWHRGKRDDGGDSFGEQVVDESYWPEFRMVAAVLDRNPKEVSSRDGMRSTVATSHLYASWAANAEVAVKDGIEYIRNRDLQALGDLAEHNAWGMHATALSARPAVCYLLPSTLELIRAVKEERSRGVPVWFTLDAGPNPVLITDADHVSHAKDIVSGCGGRESIVCTPGAGSRPTSTHLF